MLVDVVRRSSGFSVGATSSTHAAALFTPGSSLLRTVPAEEASGATTLPTKVAAAAAVAWLCAQQQQQEEEGEAGVCLCKGKASAADRCVSSLWFSVDIINNVLTPPYRPRYCCRGQGLAVVERRLHSDFG